MEHGKGHVQWGTSGLCLALLERQAPFPQKNNSQDFPSPTSGKG